MERRNAGGDVSIEDIIELDDGNEAGIDPGLGNVLAGFAKDRAELGIELSVAKRLG